MKLALVSDVLDPTTGWGRYAGEIADELISSGVDVRLVSPRDRLAIPKLRSHPDHLSIPSFQYGSRHPVRVFIRTFAPLVRALRGVDVVHCMIEPFAPVVAAASGQRPYFVSLVGTYALPSGRPRIEGMALRWALRRARGLPAISRYTRERIEADTGVLQASEVPLAVRADDFAQSNPPVREPGLIVSVGEPKPRKGYDVMLEAFATLRSEGVADRYVIVGPYNSSSPYVQRLQARINALDLQGRVTFTGVVSQQELAEWYHRARLVVMPYRSWKSDFEGFGLVLLEANACGTPVVSTRDCGAEEPVVHNMNGLLVAPDNASELLRAVRELLTDDARWEALAAGARRRVAEMTWRRSVDQLLDIYAGALGYRLDE